MFGFSLPKILLLVVIIAVVWYGFKAVGRINAKRNASEDDSVADASSSSADAEEMVQCPKCGAYFARSEPHTCSASA